MVRIDHVVILVNDLATAIADYSDLGFTVTPGGSHTDGATHNALIGFQDGSYLELLAFQREAPAHRWWRHTASGEGLIDFALVPNDIEAVITAAASRGLALDGPFDGGRLRPDGQRIAWRSGMPQSADLPFLCADVTNRSLRVPSGAAAEHANGVLGIAGISVAVHDLHLSVSRYQALLGAAALPNLPEASQLDDVQAAAFDLDQTLIGLLQPRGVTLQAQTLHARLASRGEGIVALALLGGPQSPTGDFDPQIAHGVRGGIV